MSPWRPRIRLSPSLLTRFGVVSLLLFVLLGAVLAQVLRGSIERQAVDAAVGEAEVITLLAVQRTISPDEVSRGLSPGRQRAVELALRADLAPLDVVDVTLWDRVGNVVYRQAVTSAAPGRQLLRTALEGDTVTEIRDVSGAASPALRRHDEVLEVYLPLRFGQGAARQEGVVRATLPYAPVSENIRTGSRRLHLVLGVGLALLYGLLFRTVAAASRVLRRQAARNQHLAHHDPLTGLPNRAMFQQRVAALPQAPPPDGTQTAVILMDLDRFKEVNDTLGHHHGDLLLQQVALRLRDHLRAGDTIARLGGDEFALLLPYIADEEAALGVARKIHAALESPFEVHGLRLEVGASLGIALFPAHTDDVRTLLRKADVAMYTAKNEHLGQAVYRPSEDEHSRDRLTLSAELRHGIEHGELAVYYQPQVDLRTGRLRGMESLVRWRHPVHGTLTPDEFIPIAERSDLITALMEKVLDDSLADCHRWQDRLPGCGVSVNLSVRNLYHEDLVGLVDRQLQAHGVAARLLTLEITETMVLSDPARIGETLNELRALGVRLSIDDFGTGYSSLSVLRGLPVNELKIDRIFVADVATSHDTNAIVSFSTELGHRLGLVVVAEGIEDDATLQALLETGCDVGQGYLLGKPAPVEEILRRYATHPAPSPDTVVSRR